MKEFQTQKRANIKRKAEMAVTASKAKAAKPKPESRIDSESSDSESEDDTAAISRLGFDNFCDEHLGVAVHKAWYLQLVGRLEAAYDNDEITS